MNMTRSLFLGMSLLVAGSATANDQIQVRGSGFYHAVEVGKSPPVIAETFLRPIIDQIRAMVETMFY